MHAKHKPFLTFAILLFCALGLSASGGSTAQEHEQNPDLVG